MICAYCKNIIERKDEKTICFRCEVPHHKKCWEEHKGCATDDCYENPVNKARAENVGNKTIKEILVEPQKVVNPGSPDVTYIEPAKDFDKEFKLRYKEKLAHKNQVKIVLFTSIGVIAFLLIISAVFSYIRLNEYYNSEDYKINQFMKTWESAWESKDIFRYRELLDKDYQYIDKGGKVVSYDERVKRVTKSFESVKRISVKVNDIKIQYDTVAKNYVNVKFNQTFTADKKEEKGIKTLRLFKSEETKNQWKVFREYYE